MTVPLGAISPLAANVYDQNGNLTNAGTAAFLVTQPDQTVLTFHSGVDFPNPPLVTGQYVFPFQTTQPGRHTWVFNSSSPVTVWDDVFDVGAAASPSILSLADAKQTLGMLATYTDNDAELRQKLRAITTGIENYKHQVYAYRTVTEEHPRAQVVVPWEVSKIRLTFTPVIALISVVALNPPIGGVQQIVTTYDVVNNLDLDNSTGLVTVINGPPLAGRLQAVYTAGMTIIPDNIIEGARMWLQMIWATRRGPGGLGGVVGPEEMSRAATEHLMPRKVEEMLGPQQPVVF